MYLVDEENCFLPVHSLKVLCLGNDLFHILFPCRGCVNLHKFSAGGIGNDLGKSGLSRSGGTVKNDGADFICFNRTV